MCIACELGYWSMIDAIEAERAVSRKRPGVDDAGFACEASTEPPKQPTDEPRP